RGDLKAVDELRPRAEQLLNRLQVCHDRRAELLKFAADKGLPSASLSKLATRATPNHRNKLGKQVKESAARMRLLQHQCLANWVLAPPSLVTLPDILQCHAT